MGVARTRPLLLVEDEVDLREALVEALEEHGYQVITAANGSEALEEIRHGAVRPSVIILDLMMPVMDGVAFLQHQAIDPSVGAVPVVVLTARGSIADTLVGAVVAVLPKPVPLARLLEIIETACEEPLQIPSRTRPIRDGDVRAIDHRPHGVERRRIDLYPPRRS